MFIADMLKAGASNKKPRLPFLKVVAQKVDKDLAALFCEMPEPQVGKSVNDTKSTNR